MNFQRFVLTLEEMQMAVAQYLLNERDLSTFDDSIPIEEIQQGVAQYLVDEKGLTVLDGTISIETMENGDFEITIMDSNINLVVN